MCYLVHLSSPGFRVGLAGGSSPCAPPRGCLSDLTTWRQAGRRGARSGNAVPDMAMEVTHRQFCSVLLVAQLTPDSVELGGLHQGTRSRR